MVSLPNIFTKAAIIPCLWLLSFLGAFLLLPVSDVLQTAAVVTLLTAITAYAVCTEQRPFKYNVLSFSILALWAVAANSVIWSEVKIISLTYFFFWSVFPVTFFLFSFGGGRILFKAMRWIILALGIFTLIQFYFMPHMLKFNGTHWPFEDNNSLAAMLAAGVILWFGEAMREVEHGGRWHYQKTVASLLLFAALMTTGGVAVYVGLLLVLLVFVVLGRPVDKKPIWGFIAGALFLSLVMTTSEMSVHHFVNGGAQTTANILLEKGIIENNSISGDRWEIWRSTIEIFKHYPWAGTGIGTFFLYYPEFRPITEASAGFQAHNDLLQFASEMGWMAPVITFIIVGFVIVRTIQFLRSKPSAEQRLNLLIPFAVFGLIIGHSLVNFNMYVFPTLMIVGLCLAVWNEQITGRSIMMTVSKTTREAVTFMAAMAVLIPLWGCALSEYYTHAAMRSLEAEQIQDFSSHLNLADKWGMGQNGKAVLQASRFAAATNNPETALNLLARAEHINPRLVGIYTDRAQLLAGRNQNTALNAAQRALQLDKASLTARMLVADILLKMHKDDESYQILKEGLQGPMRRTDIPEFYSVLAQRAVNVMDMQTSDEALRRLHQLTK